MSNQSKITFTAPFPFCDECKYAEIERNAFYAADRKEVYQTNRCSREPICSNAVERYKELIEERANRPYDAMGDDQGRGETGDGWYQENFKEAEAYRDNKIPEKLVTNDSVVKNPEAYSR